MTLGQFILLLVTGIGLVYFGMALTAHGPQVPADSERRYVSTFIILMFGSALAFRSDDFGIDTITYLRIFDQYCFSNINDLDLSYNVSLGLMNTLQLGACNSDWLKVTWVVLIVGCFALLPLPLPDRIKIGALGLFSLIGTELSSNALRQGLSAAIMMLAYAWFFRNRMIGLVLTIFAVLLHFSSSLVVVAVAISFFRLRYFIIAFTVLITFILSYSYLGLSIEALDRLTYEIYKYNLHGSDEIYIRVLAAAQLAVPILTTIVTRGWISARDSSEQVSSSIAFKVALTALPYLTLPYFGYRYIYGIYLVVLYASRQAVLDDRRPAFEMVLIANIVIALAWAFGSSFIRQSPFLGL